MIRPRLLLLSSAIVAACRSTAPIATTPIIGGAIGDSAAFLATIAKVDYTKDLATVQLAKSGYVVLLSVDPGGDVEQISPRIGEPAPSMLHAGVTKVNVMPPSMGMYYREALQSCVSRTVRPSTTRRQRRNVKLDAKGNPVDGGPLYEDIEVPGIDEGRANAICRSQYASMPPRHPRPAGFLLMLVASQPVSGAALTARLHALRIQADDAPQRMAGIAEGLYAGTGASWAGYYVHW